MKTKVLSKQAKGKLSRNVFSSLEIVLKSFENFAQTVYFMNRMPEQKEKFIAKMIKRFGVAGFLFFLIKGLLWLIIPALAAYFAW